MDKEKRQKSSYPERVSALVKLRVLVGYLGEKDQFDWWSTSFLSSTGRRYLELNFPRTALSAGVVSISQAARELHDQRIGRSRVFHLFRLPHPIEQDIHAHMSGDYGNELVELILDKERAIQKLDDLAEGVDVSTLGPFKVAGLSQITYSPSIRKVAASYRDAFKQSHQTFPYFTAE